VAVGAKSSTSLTSQPRNRDTISVESDADNNDNNDEFDDLELYFTDPQQLLDIFLELEEQNLSLIQNSQDTEEALEEMKQTINKTKHKMEKETELLRRQIDVLNEDIRKEVDRESELKIKASYFNYGEFKSEEQDKMLKILNKKAYIYIYLLHKPKYTNTPYPMGLKYDESELI
jgi:lipid II:glycine glycyltransferase (peptidoglycan interpeptide bridge formation enzyme)